MRKSKLFVLALVLVFNKMCFADTSSWNFEYSPKVRFQFGYGKSTFQLKKALGEFNELVDSYKELNTPLKIHQEYPSNEMFNVAFAYHLNKVYTMGLDIAHTWTRACANYKDCSGYIDVTSNVKITSLTLKIELNFITPLRLLRPVMVVYTGYTFGRYNLDQTIQIYNAENGHSYLKLTGKGKAFNITPTFGFKHHIMDHFVIFEQVGYRYSNMNDYDRRVDSNLSINLRWEEPLELNLSGSFLLCGIEILL